jgi:hypothetical protein
MEENRRVANLHVRIGAGVLAWGLVVLGPGPHTSTQAQVAPAVRALDTPASAGSQAYSLSAGADGRQYLIWIEPAGDGAHALRFSRLEGQAWLAPREISRGSNWFVNWADHPSLTAQQDGTLLAHWLVHTGKKKGSYGYGVHVARSSDQGATWTIIFEDGMQNVSDYAGFLTFGFEPGGARAVYLSPVAPDTGEAGHDHGPEPVKTLAAVHFDSSGAPIARQVIDGDVCSCCTTDIAATDEGLVAVYRDHLPGDIRDISIARLEPRGWTGPARVHADGWKIAGCPTNGPAVDARGGTVAVTWFTAANDTPRVKLAWSSDRGRSFGSPVTVDDGRPVGWPDVTMVDDGGALVSWLERRGEGIGEVLVRRVSREGVAGRPLVVAQSVSGRATGMPHMVRAGDHVLLAWRTDRVHTALVPISAIQP